LIKLKTERDKHLRQYWITTGKIPAPELEAPGPCPSICGEAQLHQTDPGSPRLTPE